MITLPDFDVSTRCASGFFLKDIAPRMWPTQLFSSLVRRSLFSLYARSFDDVIIGVGHGDRDELFGQNMITLMRVGDYNPKEVEGKFVKLLSCESGYELGPDIINNGAKAFQGYNEEYVFLFDSAYLTRPWADPLASIFLKPVVKAVSLLLDGKTNQEVFEAEAEEYDRLIYNVETRAPDTWLVRSMLAQNRGALIQLGDPEARIRPKPKNFIPISPPPLPYIGGA